MFQRAERQRQINSEKAGAAKFDTVTDNGSNLTDAQKAQFQKERDILEGTAKVRKLRLLPI